MPISLIENRTIRVFISSTFSDMNDERTELMKKTFPRLRVMAANRDVTLTEVDLRWGITKEESESGKVVDICLREIQNSIPFFIGIIGNRYGWVPSRGDIEESTFDRFDQVRSYVERKLSVTDMEMQFGVLEHKEDLHAFFYINDNKEERDNNPEKLAELKRAVRSNGRYPVFDFTSPEDLAKQVEDAFVRLLDELFPEKHSLSFLEKERISQRSFLNQLCQSYVPVKENFEKLDNFLSDENQQYLIVTGESGLGKSALVANWVKRLLDKKQTNRKIIYHFIGNGGSLGSHHHVVKTLCAELKDQFKLEPPFDERDKEKWSKEDTDTLELIYNQISVDKEGCLIVLDAVNQFVDVDNAKNLLWMGFPPRNVKVLITTLKEDVTMDVFKRREYPVFELKPLGIRQRRKLVKDYLKDSYGKHLTDDQVAAIINDRQSSNTLVLKTLLDELVSFGSFSDLEKRIQYYLEPESIPDFYQRVLARFEDDFGKDTVSHSLSLIFLSRDGLPEDAITEISKLCPFHWSQLYCSLISHLNVKMGLVSFSHRYFSEAVQQRYIVDKGDYEREKREEIVTFYQQIETVFSWSELGYQYEKLNDTQSLYSLLMRADTFLFFYENDVDSLTRWWNRLILDSSGQFKLEDYLNVTASDPQKSFAFYLFLSDFAGHNCVFPQLSLLFAEKGLNYSTDEKKKAVVFYCLGQSYSLMGNHKKALECKEKVLSLWRIHYGDSHHTVAKSHIGVGFEYGELGCHHKALDHYLKALSISLSAFGENHPDVAVAYNNIGLEYGELGDHKKALEYCGKSLSIRLSIYGVNHFDVAASYNNVGHEYGEVGDFLKALEYTEKAMSIRQKVFGDNHPSTADSYNNIGFIYGELGDYHKALEYAKKGLSIYLSIFGEMHPAVANSYNNIGFVCGEMGDHQEALEYYKKAMPLFIIIYGKNHPDLAVNYYSIGLENGKLGNHQIAIDYLKKALPVFMTFFGENHQYVAKSFNQIGIEYAIMGDHVSAIQSWTKALKIAEKVGFYKMTANMFNRIGRSYKVLGNINKANESFRRSAEKWKELGNEEQAQKSLSEIVENK